MKLLKFFIVLLASAALLTAAVFTRSATSQSFPEAPAGFDNKTNGMSDQTTFDMDRAAFEERDELAEGLHRRRRVLGERRRQEKREKDQAMHDCDILRSVAHSLSTTGRRSSAGDSVSTRFRRVESVFQEAGEDVGLDRHREILLGSRAESGSFDSIVL